MQVAGHLRAADEFMHVPTTVPSLNESMMFNFFDRTAGIGGFVRIGNRVNEGHAEVTFCLFLDDGGLLFEWARAPLQANDRFDAAGLRFEVIEPTRRLRVRYDGAVAHLRDPLQMREPRAALASSPRVPTTLDLEITGIGPIVGSASGNSSAAIFLAGVGHYQQALRANGELRVGATLRPFDAVGARDHSWGRRVWSSLLRDRSFWVTFGPDLSFVCCKTWLQGQDHVDVMGCVIEGPRVTPLRSFGVRSHFVAGTHRHDRCDLQVEDVHGRRFDLRGRVVSYVPLRHRAPGRETVFLGQAMTEFTLEGRTTLGLSEYFDAESECDGLISQSKHDACVVD